MADGKLVFLRPASGSGKLVFGDSLGGGVVIPSADLSVDAGIAGEGTASLVLRTGRTLSVDAAVAGEGAASVVLQWDANVSRGARSSLRTHWQEAAPVASSLRSAWQDSDSISVGHIARWHLARPRHTMLRTHWQATTPYRGALLSRWEQGTVARRALQSGWQETTPRRAAVIARWQQAAPARNALRQHWQENTRLRNVLRSHWQDATPIRGRFQTSFDTGQPVHVRLRSHWQEARKPPPGKWAGPVRPPDRPLCYDPARLGLLVFDTAFSGSGKLVFVCHRAGPDPEPGGTIVVPPVRVRYVINETYLTRVADGARVPVVSMTVELDYKSWAWGLNAIVPAAAQGMLAPGRRDAPREVSAWINGTEIRFIIEEMDHDRVFGERNVRVSGRGRHAELDVMQRSYSNTAPRTSLQLMQDVLTLNNVPVGYDLDYQQTPWVVPGGVFAHQGTYISALKRIAEAGGGYLRPHFNRPEFSVLPLWPRAPWDAQVADIVIPAGAVTRESMRWVDKANYNQVWVCGQEQGHRGDVRRTGTSGDVPTQMVIDELITSPDAAQQRGLSILADTGLQREIGLSLPVLPATGIIVPGKYIDYEDGSTHYKGLVRSVSVRVDEGFVEQTISIQSHHE